MTDQNGSGYWSLFKKKAMRAFYPAWWPHTFTVTPSPAALCSSGLAIPSVPEVPPGPGRSPENWVGSLCAVAYPHPSQLFLLKVPRHASFLVFLQLPDLQDLPSLPGSLLQQDLHCFRIIFFLRPVFIGILFSASPFQILSSPVFPISRVYMLKHNTWSAS